MNKTATTINIMPFVVRDDLENEFFNLVIASGVTIPKVSLHIPGAFLKPAQSALKTSSFSI